MGLQGNHSCKAKAPSSVSGNLLVPQISPAGKYTKMHEGRETRKRSQRESTAVKGKGPTSCALTTKCCSNIWLALHSMSM
eukprot:1158641-Pelagomonas_calceolata.AAC.12